MRRWFGWALAVGLGCPDTPAPQGSPAADARRYAELLTADDPRPAMAGCASLSGEDERGDCTLALAQRVRDAEGVALSTLCPQVPAGTWRDECWFVAAEDAARAGQKQHAAQSCTEAGAFKHECGQHLWQKHLRRLVRTPREQPLDERLARAQRLYGDWRPLLPWSDMDWRYWRYFFETVLEQSPGIDLRTCDGLGDDELRLRCRYAGGHLYLRRVWDHLHHRDDRARFCALEPRTVAMAEGAFARLQARPDPLLQAVLDEQAEAVCGRDAHGPVEDGVVSEQALDAALAAQRP